MKTIHPISLAALCLALSACGGSGGGGGVASTPAPIPAAAPSPAPSPSPTPPPVTITSSTFALTPLTDRAGLVAGTYQPIAISYDRVKGSAATGIFGAQTVRILDPSATRLTVNPATKSYTLEMNLAGFPGQKMLDLTKTDNDNGDIVDSKFGNHVVQTDIYSDGTRKVSEYDEDALDVVGPFVDVSSTAATRDFYGIHAMLRYVSLGYWLQDDIERTGLGLHGQRIFRTAKCCFRFRTENCGGRAASIGHRDLSGQDLPRRGVTTRWATPRTTGWISSSPPNSPAGKSQPSSARRRFPAMNSKAGNPEACLPAEPEPSACRAITA